MLQIHTVTIIELRELLSVETGVTFDRVNLRK